MILLVEPCSRTEEEVCYNKIITLIIKLELLSRVTRVIILRKEDIHNFLDFIIIKDNKIRIRLNANVWCYNQYINVYATLFYVRYLRFYVRCFV